MDRHLGKAIGALALLLFGLLAQNAAAGDPAERKLGAEWVPIDPARLDGMRGGFMLPSGLVLSFGIERAVYVNGELAASVSVRIPDMSRITAADAQALARFNEGMVVQVGEGNRFEPTSLPGGVVIQNTLNDQHIVTVTQLDISSGALAGFQELNLGNALRDSLITTGGTR